MLHLYDPRTGRTEPVTPARRGVLRLQCCGLAAGTVAGLGELRALLLPDLIRRAAERQRLKVITCQPSAGAAPGDAASGGADGGGADSGVDQDAAAAALRDDCAALNFRPPDLTGPYDLGGTCDIHTGGTGLPCPLHGSAQPSPAGPGMARHWLDSAPLTWPGGPAELSGLTSRGVDPLALRLALLGARYRQVLRLDWDMLAAAGTELDRWRELVADWARSPSKPISPAWADEISAAFDDDLDTPAALGALRRLVGDPAAAAGSKFETFADADRLFGLDLARDVGRYP